MTRTYAWQQPISMSVYRGLKGWERAHYMPVSDAKNELLPALCGRKFNPGFAKPNPKLQHCARCKRKLGMA